VEVVAAGVDAALDWTVLPGFSRLGYRMRRPFFTPGDPEPGSLQGRVVVVTGANSGIGLAVAAGCTRLGGRVVLAVRSMERGRTAAASIRRAFPEADLDVLACDVADLDSVRRFATDLSDRVDRLDVVVHNAGILPSSRMLSPQGHELTLATHVLGPALMTELLRPLLRKHRAGRVIWVSSGGMYTAPLPADDPEYVAASYRGARAYARTKRLQVAFTPLTAAELAEDGTVVASMHPGWVDTPGLASSLPGFRRCARPLLRTPAEGADTVVWLAATQPGPPSGLFWHDRRPRRTHAFPWQTEHPDAVERVWRWCREAAGVESR
jgi:NAD(P)-dependent dehydrogenase (short-subunit alcohol dehydrogenase family)